MKKVMLLTAIVSMLSVQVMAGIYVDAVKGDGGNTFNAVTGSATDWAAGRANDGKWNARTGQCNNVDFKTGGMGGTNCTVFTASDDNPGEDAVALYTVASGLTPGWQYDVSVVYWSAYYNGVNFCVRAGSNLNSMILFDKEGTLAGATKGTATGKLRDGDRDEYMGLIGRIAADANGQIRVYIDDLPVNPGFTNNNRTYYDGIMVSVPEPASMMILALGGLMAFKRK